MSTLTEITSLERVYFEIQRIRKEIDALEGFLLSELKRNHSAKPRSNGMIDPRDGQLFRKKEDAS